MRNRLIAAGTATMAFAATLNMATAETCDRTFSLPPGVTGGVWQFPGNWSGGQAPSSTGVACIPDGKEASIVPCYCVGGTLNGQGCGPASSCPGGTAVLAPDVAVGAIRVGPSDDLAATQIEVGADTSLTLNGASVPSRLEGGTLYLQFSSELIISGNVTIEGNGGVIEGEFAIPSGEIPARITGGGTLTLQGDNNANESTSLRLDEIVTIEAALVNNAYVIATFVQHLSGEPVHTMTLTGYPKSGSGVWAASKEPPYSTAYSGILVVDAQVTGSGTWRLETPGAMIRVDSPCTGLTGPVILTEGLFEVNAEFATTGAVSLSNDAEIYVEAGTSASFGPATISTQ